MSTPYETDFAQWTQEQALLLQEGRWTELDLPHLLEEIEGLAASEHRALRSHLIVLLTHLLKLGHATLATLQRTERGWRLTCTEQRRNLADVVQRSPSLARELERPETLERGERGKRKLWTLRRERLGMEAWG